jgi:hypothetical protein
MIAMEVAHQDEVNEMLHKPGQTEAFTASAVREPSVVRLCIRTLVASQAAVPDGIRWLAPQLLCRTRGAADILGLTFLARSIPTVVIFMVDAVVGRIETVMRIKHARLRAQ